MCQSSARIRAGTRGAWPAAAGTSSRLARTGPNGSRGSGRIALVFSVWTGYGWSQSQRGGNRVDNPAAYLHLGFVVISLPNLALIAGMVAIFVVALVAPFPGARGRRGGER